MRAESASPLPQERALVPWYAGPVFHLALNATLITVSEVLLKKGALASAAGRPPDWLVWTGLAALGSGWVLAGILCYIAAFANWLYLLRTVPLHIAYPVTNLSHALIPMASWVFFGERFGLSRAAGIALIIAGTWVIARPPERRGSVP